MLGRTWKPGLEVSRSIITAASERGAKCHLRGEQRCGGKLRLTVSEARRGLTTRLTDYSNGSLINNYRLANEANYHKQGSAPFESLTKAPEDEDGSITSSASPLNFRRNHWAEAKVHNPEECSSRPRQTGVRKFFNSDSSELNFTRNSLVSLETVEKLILSIYVSFASLFLSPPLPPFRLPSRCAFNSGAFVLSLGEGMEAGRGVNGELMSFEVSLFGRSQEAYDLSELVGCGSWSNLWGCIEYTEVVVSEFQGKALREQASKVCCSEGR